MVFRLLLPQQMPQITFKHRHLSLDLNWQQHGRYAFIRILHSWSLIDIVYGIIVRWSFFVYSEIPIATMNCITIFSPIPSFQALLIRNCTYDTFRICCGIFFCCHFEVWNQGCFSYVLISPSKHISKFVAVKAYLSSPSSFCWSLNMLTVSEVLVPVHIFSLPATEDTHALSPVLRCWFMWLLYLFTFKNPQLSKYFSMLLALKVIFRDIPQAMNVSKLTTKIHYHDFGENNPTSHVPLQFGQNNYFRLTPCEICIERLHLDCPCYSHYPFQVDSSIRNFTFFI